MANRNRTYLYLLSFLEGGCVMACEIIGAKLLAPYFGTSLYVWAAALGITLGGLMTGYFLGGVISRRVRDNQKALYYILITAGAFLFFMPFTSVWIMDMTLHMSLQWGAVLALSCFMFPPLVFMGMVSPLIINLMTDEARSAGNSAGNVYAISTLGGIMITFLLGFYIIPEFGITTPAMIGGFALGILPAISLMKGRKSYLGLVALLFMAVIAIARPSIQQDDQDYETIFHSEGIMGQLKVIDFVNDGTKARGLVVNNTLQTVVDLSDKEYDYWPYTRLIQHFTSRYPAGSNVLLLGMGGGTLVQRLQKLDFGLDIVEIDKRIEEVAIKYFGLEPGLQIHVDDARHFVRICDSTYSIVIYDVFKGEEAPSHVLTLESLHETKAILDSDGMILINFYGYLEGSLGLLTRSIGNTLVHAGFHCELYATPGDPDHRNVVMVGWPLHAESPLQRQVIEDREIRLDYEPVALTNVTLEDAYVLTDERPQLQLYGKAAMQWRRLYNAYFLK